MKSLSSMVTANRVVASDWMEVSFVISAVRGGGRETSSSFFVLFCYLITFTEQVFTYLFFVPVFYLHLLSFCPSHLLHLSVHVVYLTFSSAWLQLPIPNVLYLIFSFIIKYFLSSFQLCSCEFSPVCHYQSV